MTAINLPVHSRLGPSGSYRWLNCVGSPNLIAKLGLTEEDGESEEAALGTVLHNITAECLLKDMEPWEFSGRTYKQAKWEFLITEAHTPLIEKNLNFVRDLFAQYEPMGAILHVETRVKSELDPEAYGTADIRIEVPGVCIIILDFKYGMVRVDPDDSQLKEYGYMSYEMRSPQMRGAGEPRIIELIIAQPRLPNPRDHFRKAKFTPKELEDWFVGVVVPAMRATRDPNAPLCMGEWCKFCPANTTAKCPAIFNEIKTLPVAAHPSSFTNEQIGKMKSLKPIFDKFFMGLDGEAMTRMRDRQEYIPGWKLVHKLGNRVWKDKVEIDDGKGGRIILTKEEYAAKHVGDKAYEPAKLKSPAQIEKLPGGNSMTSLFAFKPDTGITLAPDDDTREPAVGLMQRADAATAADMAAAVVADTVF
jgi:hypothetical protein